MPGGAAPNYEERVDLAYEMLAQFPQGVPATVVAPPPVVVAPPPQVVYVPTPAPVYTYRRPDGRWERDRREEHGRRR